MNKHSPVWVIERRSEFLKSIPEEVLAAVAPYSSRHWHLPNLIARCPGALDLVRATPALAFALASLGIPESASAPAVAGSTRLGSQTPAVNRRMARLPERPQHHAHSSQTRACRMLDPQRAGKKLWGKERIETEFNEANNCKDPGW